MQATVALDKTILVPPGQTVRTGYVHVDRVRIACKAPMAIGDVERRYEAVKQMDGHAVFPAPVGHWEGDTFVIVDGRHLFIAYVLNGYTSVLVAWLEPDPSLDANAPQSP